MVGATLARFSITIRITYVRNGRILLFNVFNLFTVNAPILYSLKTPENLWFSGMFWRYKMGTLDKYWLIKSMALF